MPMLGRKDYLFIECMLWQATSVQATHRKSLNRLPLKRPGGWHTLCELRPLGWPILAGLVYACPPQAGKGGSLLIHAGQTEEEPTLCIKAVLRLSLGQADGASYRLVEELPAHCGRRETQHARTEHDQAGWLGSWDCR